MDVTEEFEYKSIEGHGGGNVSVDQKEGIVECFVAAIGNKDSVGDVIQPKAFDGSLKRRKPRVVWGHDWNQPIGKVLEVYEVGPMDPRLPLKMKMAGVGGLFARVQFNLKSQKGKDAFEDVLFFGEDQEWSIGYKTLDSVFDPHKKATLLKEVELYEMSPVLHGANQLTSTISIKSEADPALDNAIRRGLAMAKTYLDENPEVEAKLKELLDDDLEVKGGKPSSDFRGEILGGRGPRRGNLEDLLDYWRPIMKKPGGFRRCVVVLADHPELGDIRRLCAWLHHETTGKWPNEGNHHGKSVFGEPKSSPAVGFSATVAHDLSAVLGVKVALEAVEEKSVKFRVEDDEQLYKSDFTVSDNGAILFGVKRAVHPCKDGEPCECDGACKTEKSLKEDIDELEEKIGRRISGGNMAKLQQALDLLKAVVESGAVVDVEMKSFVVEGGFDGLREALQVVADYHNPGSEVTESYGILRMNVKSEDQLKAIQKVAQHFGTEVQEA